MLGRKATSGFEVLAHNEDRESATTNEAAVRLNTPNLQVCHATRCGRLLTIFLGSEIYPIFLFQDSS
jgi:hypothetical protein